jgi:hypothetical protein
MGREPQVIVFNVRDIAAGSGHQSSMPVSFPDTLSLGKDEDLDASIATGVLLRAFDRFGWGAIAHDQKLEFRNGLRQDTLDGIRQKDRGADNGKQNCILRCHGDAQTTTQGRNSLITDYVVDTSLPGL